MSNDIIEKLKKMRNMCDDKSLTEAEKETWREKYNQLKKQYNILESHIEEEKKEQHRILASNSYEFGILINIVVSYNITPYQLSKSKESKNSLRFESTKKQAELIKDDFKYYKYFLNLILQAATWRFAGHHIPVPERNENSDRKLTKEEIEMFKLMNEMDFIDDMNLKKHKQIGL